MRERPILMSAPMVRALLAGTKTQTRRVVKGWPLEWVATGMFTREYTADPANDACPYGKVGDRLWVRETWRRAPGLLGSGGNSTEQCEYRATYRTYGDGDDTAHAPKWTPSIHMPRWASRLTLELTGVRIERLQEISEADAQSEGCIAPMYASDESTLSFAVAYRHLWEAINGAGTWDANPYVWCLDFRRV